MINDQELLFIVDENNKPLKPEPRSFAHKKGLWHRTSGVWITNKEKQILCQKRSLQKDIRPGMWEAFFGGHLAPGEEYGHNAAAEVSEELGIGVNESMLIPYKVFGSDKLTHKEFQQVFGLMLDVKCGEFSFEKEEIDQLSWKPIEEIRNILVVQRSSEWVLKPWDEEVLDWLASLQF